MTNPKETTTEMELFLAHRPVNTEQGYRRDILEFERYMAEQHQTKPDNWWTLVEPVHVRAWQQGLQSTGRKATTINRKRAALASFFNWLIWGERLTRNPASSRYLRLKREQHIPVALTKNEIEAVVNAAKERGALEYHVITMLAFTGLRVSELCDLNTSDYIQNGDCYLRVRQAKGQKDRLVPLAGRVLAVLNPKPTDPPDSPLITGYEGERLERGRIWRMVRRCGKEAGVANLYPHRLRHFCASEMLRQGVELRHISVLLGHSSIKTTEIYLDSKAEGLEEAVRKAFR